MSRQVDRRDRGEILVEHITAEVLRREGDDRNASSGGEHAPQLRERAGTVDQMDNRPQDRGVEVRALEREMLGGAELQTHRPRDAPPGLRQHLWLWIDAPHTRDA